MKKIILFLSCILLLFGCEKYGANDLINKLDKKVSNAKNYQLTGTLEIFRNEEKFIYDVVSTYKTGEYFKVELTNKENNHEQIILKDLESVYVLTPSLNKNFKFQSEWPYNNSQIYLLQPIILDVKNDKNNQVEKSDSGYIITSNVNYSSEKNFKKQKIYFDKQDNFKKIEVVDDQNNVKMCLKITNIEYNKKLKSDFFDINKYQKTIDPITKKEDGEMNNSNSVKNSSKSILDEIVYPMYVPVDTYLLGQDVISTDNGERVILTFVGNSEFTFIQENADYTETMGYIYGDPYLIRDTVGAVTDYSVSWISNGIEYSVMSDTMLVDELLTVAQSISVETVGK